MVAHDTPVTKVMLDDIVEMNFCYRELPGGPVPGAREMK